MNEYNIYKKCLSMFNIELTKSAWANKEDEEKSSHEINLCNTWLNSAFLRALRESKWTFLTEPINIRKTLPQGVSSNISSLVGTQDQNSTTVSPQVFGYRNAYVIEDSIYEITNVIPLGNRREKVNYRVYGNVIYTDFDNISVVGIKEKAIGEYLNVPQEFEDMVAYALALLIAPSIAPKDINIQQLINTQYSWATDRLLRLECNSNIRRTYHEEIEL